MRRLSGDATAGGGGAAVFEAVAAAHARGGGAGARFSELPALSARTGRRSASAARIRAHGVHVVCGRCCLSPLLLPLLALLRALALALALGFSTPRTSELGAHTAVVFVARRRDAESG